MKKLLTLAAMAAAMMTLFSCGGEQKKTEECKFNAEQYAEEHTARLNEIVTLTEEQNKEVKAIFLEEAKEVEANIKEMKGECKKAECDKANCDKKAECKKAECDKANCDKKAECKKAECKKDGHRHNHCMVSPATKKANMEKIKALLTPEQVALLDAHRAQKSECMQPTECCTAK